LRFKSGQIGKCRKKGNSIFLPFIARFNPPEENRQLEKLNC
jgi:hypothetical protein